MRRPSAILLIALVVATAGYTLWNWRVDQPADSDPWRAVPGHTAMVVQLAEPWSTWDRAIHTSQLWGTASRIPAVAGAARVLDRMAQRMEKDAVLRGALEGRPVLAAMLRSGGDRAGLLLVGSHAPPATALAGPLSEVLAAEGATRTALEQGQVVQVLPDTALPELSVCLQGGLWLLASDPGVMDEALLQLEQPAAITQDSTLAKALGTLGAGADAYLLVHTARAHRLLHTWWTPASLETLEPPAGWAALDLRIRPHDLLMSGLLVPEPGRSFAAGMEDQGTGGYAALRALPSSVAMVRMQHLADARSWPDTVAASDTDLLEALLGWVQGWAGTAAAPGQGEAPDLHWAFFEAGDPDAAVDALNTLCIAECDTLSYRGFRITRLPVSGAHERLLGPSFAVVERPWWTPLGDVLLFCDRPEGVYAAIDAWNDGGALRADARTSDWFERISAEAAWTFWCDVARARHTLRRGLKEAPAGRAQAADSLWRDLGGLSIQLSPGQRGFHHLTVGLGHAPLVEAPPRHAWSTPLGSPVDRAPWIVRNHVNGTREVLVQDTLHRLHLLASTGKVLWTRKLDGPVLGDVAQVDRYRNGKLQLLFNTATTVHLIDRNGNDVGGFPAPLPAPASAPLAVFDYENERDYRVLVPLNDGRVLNLGLDGEAVKGWSVPRLSAPALGPVVHLRIKGRDHLVVVDQGGNVHVFDRRGEVRERVGLKLASPHNMQALWPGQQLGASRILWTDDQGRLFSSSLDGAQLPLSSRPNAVAADLDGSGVEVVLATSGDSLLAVHGGVERTLSSMGGALAPDVQVLPRVGSSPWLVVALADADRMSILEPGGLELDGSPVAGRWAAGPADLDLDGRQELVTVQRDGTVMAHRLRGTTTDLP